MLSRTRHIDLSMGSMEEGIDENKAKELNYWAENQTHHDCIHCVYQSFCGNDIVDDISRYKRFDIPKGHSVLHDKLLSLISFSVKFKLKIKNG